MNYEAIKSHGENDKRKRKRATHGMIPVIEYPGKGKTVDALKCLLISRVQEDGDTGEFGGSKTIVCENVEIMGI